MSLGEKLKQARLTKNFSQEYMAEVLQISQKTYSNFENNKMFQLSLCKLEDFRKNKFFQV